MGGNLRLPGERLGLLGDVHGEVGELLRASIILADRGVHVLVQLGDFGMPWPKEPWTRALDNISRRLRSRAQLLYFVDGNHDWTTMLNDRTALTRTAGVWRDGVRWLTREVAYIPRGTRGELYSGRSFAALGGAGSVDFDWRRPGVNWWPEEVVSDDNLAQLGQGAADVLFAHDIPLGVPGLDNRLARQAGSWSPAQLAYAQASREKFHRGFLAVEPRLHVGAHYHLHVDEPQRFVGARGIFETRIVALDQLGGYEPSMAVLDTRTLALEFIAPGLF